MLTVEEVKALTIGDWIWLTDTYNINHIGYCKVDNIFPEDILFASNWGSNSKPFNTYGTTWLAYRNKDEAEAEERAANERIQVGLNADMLRMLSRYMLPKGTTLAIAKEIEIELCKARQSIKETIIKDLKAVVTPEFTTPGKEILPANTIELIDEKYDWTEVINTPISKIDFVQ